LEDLLYNKESVELFIIAIRQEGWLSDKKGKRRPEIFKKLIIFTAELFDSIELQMNTDGGLIVAPKFQKLCERFIP
jgi:hypothetical protein